MAKNANPPMIMSIAPLFDRRLRRGHDRAFREREVCAGAHAARFF
jgi:hypothetical protein